MTTNFDAQSDKVLSPAYLAHIVLRTNKFKEMAAYYKTFLGASISHENEMLSFLTFDEEHHHVAIARIPNTTNRTPNTCGLEHFAFTYRSLTDLALAYRQRKARGILPVWCINHGPTTSIYYCDTDGNRIETQVDNFDTVEEIMRFIQSPEFAENPIGTDFDPEILVERLQRGDEEKEIKKREEIGLRGLLDVAQQ
ncbi:hypothetical protein B7463_g11556, partial [Scytalidium lignicola]